MDKKPAEVELQTHLGKVQVQHTEGSHKMCRVYCQMWTRYWTQSRQFLCSSLRPAANSRPARTTSDHIIKPHSFDHRCNVSKCRFIQRDYVTPLMRYCLKCPANRYIFKSRLNCSESTAGSLRQSGSEFQTVGLATEKARVPKVLRRTRGTNSW